MCEAEKVSELHLEVKAALMNEDFEKIKNWQKDSFHKQMIGGFKETKEAEDGFRKAQKPWAKKMKEVKYLLPILHLRQRFSVAPDSTLACSSSTAPLLTCTFTCACLLVGPGSQVGLD